MATQRVKIEARLSTEGAEILGADWVALDLERDFSPRFSKDVNTLSDLNKLITDGMLNFSVPRSKTNDIVFIDSGSPIITDNRDTGVECRISVDGRQYPFDRIWVKNKTAKDWEIEVRRSPNHWLELASLKKLNTIDLGTELIDNTIVENLADQYFVEGGAITRWFPCDYGNFVDLADPVQFTDPPVKEIYYEDLRPWFCIPELLRLGFCEIGWTLQGQILDTKWSRALFAYILKRDYYTESRGGDHILIGHNTTEDDYTLTQIEQPAKYNTISYDPGSNSIFGTPDYIAGIINSLPYKAKYRFSLILTVENPTVYDVLMTISVGAYDFGVNFTGEIFWSEQFTIPTGGTEIIAIDQFIDIESDSRAAFLFTGISDGAPPEITPLVKISAMRLRIEPFQQSLVRGDNVELRNLIHPDYFLLDLFKGYIHMIGGRLDTDIENKTLTVYPFRFSDVFGDEAEGFIQDDELPIELDGKIICDSLQISRIKNSLPRYTRLAFADTTDAYVNEFVKPTDPLFSRKVLNGEDLQDTVQELKNPFFEPTYEAHPQILRQKKNITRVFNPTPYMPILHDNTEGNRSFAIGPRVLFFYGAAQQLDTATGLECTVFLENSLTPGLATASFGYASHLPTLGWVAGEEPEIDARLIYGSKPDDLYVKFYLDTLSIQKTGFSVNALALITGPEYSEWNFRKKFIHTIGGKPVVMMGQRIRDFAAALDIPTPIDFVVDAPNTTCCDLPCSCRFTECDYYQDFGQYMNQSTLDELSITSFKVNNIEQLLAPVDFGVLKVVEFNGRQFVMNMVEALEACGVDYFDYRPSTAVYSGKPDARFFKIKRPTCWTFEIIISDADGEVYKYTESTQFQKWFGSDWEPFGYGGDPIDEPLNCQITVEY
jgi:hypothetical protein